MSLRLNYAGKLILSIPYTVPLIIHGLQVRLEELETRITQLNGELAKLLRLKLKVESGLRDMEQMSSVEDLRVQGKRLWYDCCKCSIDIPCTFNLSRTVKD